MTAWIIERDVLSKSTSRITFPNGRSPLPEHRPQGVAAVGSGSAARAGRVFLQLLHRDDAHRAERVGGGTDRAAPRAVRGEAEFQDVVAGALREPMRAMSHRDSTGPRHGGVIYRERPQQEQKSNSFIHDQSSNACTVADFACAFAVKVATISHSR
ncbi:MAG: hypothetical protein QM770_22510 [Tepidisphaeraceae bacterium]